MSKFEVRFSGTFETEADNRESAEMNFLHCDDWASIMDFHVVEVKK